MQDQGYQYDCGLEEGYEMNVGAANAWWPYTVDNGSPNAWTQKVNGEKIYMNAFPTGASGNNAVWELPVNAFIVPYNLRPTIWSKYRQISKGSGETWAFNPALAAVDSIDWCYSDSITGGKITGFDFNMFILWGMTKSEWLTTMKYNFDKRIAGNKAPIHFGCHTDYYTPIYDNATLLADFNKNGFGLVVSKGWNTWTDRKAAVSEFIDYVTSKSAHCISGHELIEELKKIQATETVATAQSVNAGWSYYSDVGGATPAVTAFDGSATDISMMVPIAGSDCGYEAEVVTPGSTAGLTHVSLTYKTTTPLKFKLITDNFTSWEVLLANVGPEISSGKIPLSAFHLNEYLTEGGDTVLDPARIIGMEISPQSADTLNPIPATFSMKNLTFYCPQTPVVGIIGNGNHGVVSGENVALRAINGRTVSLSIGQSGTYNISIKQANGRTVKSLQN